MNPLFKKLCLTTCAALFPLMAHAQSTFPTQPLHMVTAFGAGSASDIVARMIAQKLQEELGQPVIVDNKPGASGQIASDYVARAQADGYTIMLATNTTHSSNPHLFKQLRYHPIDDFTPLVQVCNFPFVLAVSKETPVSSVEELVKFGKKQGGSVNYGYGNSTGQISAASFNKMTNLGATAVPYKSSPQAMTDLIGGRVNFMFVDLASAAGHIESGALRALAVSTEQRSALAPDLPAVSEALGMPGFDLAAWVGIFGPAKMPEDVTTRLADALYAIVSSDEVQKKLVSMGAEPKPAPADEFGRFVAAQLDVWGEKVRQSGIEPQ